MTPAHSDRRFDRSTGLPQVNHASTGQPRFHRSTTLPQVNHAFTGQPRFHRSTTLPQVNHASTGDPGCRTSCTSPVDLLQDHAERGTDPGSGGGDAGGCWASHPFATRLGTFSSQASVTTSRNWARSMPSRRTRTAGYPSKWGMVKNASGQVSSSARFTCCPSVRTPTTSPGGHSRPSAAAARGRGRSARAARRTLRRGYAGGPAAVTVDALDHLGKPERDGAHVVESRHDHHHAPEIHATRNVSCSVSRRVMY